MIYLLQHIQPALLIFHKNLLFLEGPDFQQKQKRSSQPLPNGKKYVCGTCGKEFPRKDNLTRHIRTHSNARPYKCDECGTGFKFNYLLTRHKRTHINYKPCKCPVCQIGIKEKANVRTDKNSAMNTVSDQVQPTSSCGSAIATEDDFSDWKKKLGNYKPIQKRFKCSRVKLSSHFNEKKSNEAVLHC